jgi:H+/Cl- antiporter ClcA
VVVKLSRQETAVLTTAGSFSAISALFGGPLVAGMLMVEAGVGMGAMLIPALLPGLVAAAVGYLLFIGLGSWGGLDTTALTIPDLPAYDGTHVLDLAVAIGVGVVTAFLVAAVRKLATLVDGLGHSRLGMPGLLVGGGLTVGLLALLARWLGADSQDVLFSGQTAIPGLVAESSAGIVVILLVAKAIGYAVSLGAGFRGGPVFPAIFLGVAVGMLAGIAFDVSPTLAVAVGAAAGMASMTRLVFASLLFSALLVGTNGIDTVPAAVLATAAAWIVTMSLERQGARSGQAAAR